MHSKSTRFNEHSLRARRCAESSPLLLLRGPQPREEIRPTVNRAGQICCDGEQHRGGPGAPQRERQLHGRGNFDRDLKDELDFSGEEGEHSSRKGHRVLLGSWRVSDGLGEQGVGGPG